MKLLLHTKANNILILSIMILSSCGKQPLPQDIDDFLRNFSYEKASNAVSGGVFKETYTEFEQNDSGTVLIDKQIDFVFSKKDDQDFEFTANYTTTENNKTTKKTIQLYKTEQFYLKTSEDGVDRVNHIDLSTAQDYYQRIFYSSWVAYPTGGLYYGDYIVNQIYNIVNIVTIDQEKKTLSFEYSNNDTIENALLSQKCVIDENGMLLYFQSRIDNLLDKKVGITTQEASYTTI